MNYLLAKKQVKSKYDTTPLSNDVEQINIMDMFDAFNYCYIALIDINNEAYLTDFANNLEDINTFKKRTLP